MNAASLSPADVAKFLRDHPSFFQDHADIFAELRVPHPYEKKAISLGERQVMTLRSRAKELELRLAGLMHNATGNEKISRDLHDWCCRMLAEDDTSRLPEHIVQSLGDVFELSDIALRVWGVSGATSSEYTAEVSADVRSEADGLTEPYCGPYSGEAAAQILAAPPASLAIMALRSDPDAPAFGVLVLGAADSERFTSEMATDFLSAIARLASASLMRLSVATCDELNT